MLPESNIAIQTHQLSKTIGTRRVLREIDWSIAKGECVALLGDNGAGKTTLLRCLAGSLQPTAGQVRWFGQAVSSDVRQRRIIGMVAHESRLYQPLTVRENLLFAARMHSLSDPMKRCDEVLDRVELGFCADRPTREISKGMCQRLSLARALIHDPPILLLDEPFSGLDSAGCDWLLDMLRDRRSEGRAICFSTHGDDWKHVADRVTRLKDGALLRANAIGDATAGDALRSAG
ncbi:MAG: heme ABC exporter ATP-binding protein CcmA [Planctomycetales bacterium]|nr:heme ABC exporter ATP-binding protein CcmA [Planctomycetales bacterium]